MYKIALGVFILLSLIQCKPALDESTIDNKLSTFQIKEAFDKKNRWLIEDDKDSLATIIHPKALYGHSNCWVQSAEDLTIGNPEDSLKYLAIQVDELTVDAIGHTGIVQGVGHFKGLFKRDTFDMDLCFIETYALVNKNWVLVGRQSAKLPLK